MGENPLALLARSSRLRRDPIPAKPAKTQTQTLRAPLSISDTGKCAQPLILSWTDYLRGLSPARGGIGGLLDFWMDREGDGCGTPRGGTRPTGAVAGSSWWL